MWILLLNHIRDKAEIVQPVARAETKEALERFLESERVPQYREKDEWSSSHIYGDRTWLKSYRKGGPLEYYNTPRGHDDHFCDIGTEKDAMVAAAERWREIVGSVPSIDGE